MAATDPIQQPLPPPVSPPPQAALADWLRLQHTGGVGLLTAHRLLGHFRHPGAIFSASHQALCLLVKPEQARALLQAPSPGVLDAECDAIFGWLESPAHRLLAWDDPAYPAALHGIAAAPLLLYAAGRAPLLSAPSLAVVGSRNGSTQGVLNAQRMAQALSDAGLSIVSGLALGIDAAAHQGGLRGAGSTIAVVGTGVDVIYPARNRVLAQRIAAEGCLVSEYGLGTAPRASNFPHRNRIISGLARGVLVVEAAARSGSLITARMALEQGRAVYAIPGSIHASLSKGCHELIRRDGAMLVETAEDILSDLQLIAPGAARPAIDDSFVDRVLQALGDDPAAPDALAARLAQDMASLQGQLLALELAGLVERLPGGMFQRLRG